MKKTFIIAEAGVNHNGKVELAEKLIDVAAEAKVDAVKFQSAVPELVVSAKAGKADYQKRLTGEGSQLDMIRKIHFELDVYVHLKEYCRKKGVEFLSSPFDHVSIDFLDELGISLFKIPSGELTNKPYLQHVAKLGKPLILSTGMADITEIERAVNLLYDEGVNKKDLSILHCNTEYPTPMSDVNLNAMSTLRSHFGIEVGYSDHTEGIEVPIAAVALGATIIEKHFTLDKTMTGPDHKASLSPDELISMVKAIRNIEQAMGSYKKEPSASELKNKGVARRSIHLTKDTAKGTVITRDLLVMKRPGTGISPFDTDSIIGRILTKDVFEDDILLLTDLA